MYSVINYDPDGSLEGMYAIVCNTKKQNSTQMKSSN